MSARHNASRLPRRIALCNALLLSLASTAQAAPPVEQPVATPAMECDASGCKADGDLLFTLRSRSYDEPVTEGTSTKSSSQVLEPDRRVSLALDEPGKATVTGNFLIRLPEGGAIWATEDPAMGLPELSVSAPSLVA